MDEGVERTFEIGLTMAGAVSAGAYTAGVVDFLLEALEAWYQQRALAPDSVPSHGVNLRVMSGASAGAMTAAIVAANALDRFPAVRPGSETTTGPSNPLFTAWVDRIDISQLLKQQDLAGGARPVSLLDTTIIDRIGDQVLNPKPGQPRAYFAQNLRVVATLTNIPGVPYGFQSRGNGSYQEGMVSHGDFVRFAVTNGGVGPAPPVRSQVGWSYEYEIDLSKPPPLNPLFKDSAIASAAFPFGLRPRELTRNRSDYGDRPILLQAGVPGQPPLVVHLQPAWPHGCTVREKPAYHFVNFDGGCIDNDPFEFARSDLAGGLTKRNDRDGDTASKAVIIIDPFPQVIATSPAESDQHVPLQKALFTLLGVYKEQACFKPEELALAISDDVYSRFLIAPSRPEPGNNGGPDDAKKSGPWIACGALDGFSGFLSHKYRLHDYWLGRRNCQQFLRSHFTLKEDNPLFDGWRDKPWAQVYRVPQASGGAELPIIPLVGAVRAEEALPLWPYGAFDGCSIRNGIKARADAIFKRWMEGESFFSKIAKVAWWAWGKNALADKVVAAVNEGLAAQRLIDSAPNSKGIMAMTESTPSLVSNTDSWLKFASTLVWPVFVLLILWMYDSPISRFLKNVTHVKTEWFEAEVDSSKVALSIRDVLLSILEGQEGAAIDAGTLGQISKVFGDIDLRRLSLSDRRILWVDPKPTNNLDLINSFQVLGIRVFLSYSSCDAKRHLLHDSYSLIITNMARAPEQMDANDPEKCSRIIKDAPGDTDLSRYGEGEQFLMDLTNSKNKVPVVVYASRWGGANQGKEDKWHVARIAQDTPDLYTFVLKTLSSQ